MISEEKTIERAAVLHIPLSEYAFAESENTLIIRIRTKKNDLSACILYYADRVCRRTPVEFEELQMTVCTSDEYFDYYEAKIDSVFNRICYYFKLVKGREWTLYYADRFTRRLPDTYIDDKIIDGRSEYYQFPFIMKNEIPDVPKWFKDAVVYNIFPDSFANGHRILKKETSVKRMNDGRVCRSRLGGTLKGIKENLDYIQEMGFTCIYLNPIFIAGEYHKYDVLDYYHIDPCLGTDADFLELVDELHLRGMKIIIDGVFNHCSWDFFAFADVVEKGRDSRYCKWFYKLEFPVVRPQDENEIPGYTCFAYERKMPKLNTSEREVQMYFADVGAYWIKKYHVDGWRLDVANEIDRNFWRRFRAAVKQADPEAVLIGEVWENAQIWLKGDMFDSTMNYEFRRICREYLASMESNALTAAYQFGQMLLRYPKNLVNGQLNLIDSHDVPRFLSLCRGNKESWRLACVLLVMMPGVPSLFYGDEQWIEGVTEDAYRSRMEWKTENDCAFISELIQIRKNYVNTDTTYSPIWTLINKGVLAFCRKNPKSEITIMVNTGEMQEIQEIEPNSILLSDKYEAGRLMKNGYCIYQSR